MTIDPTAPGFRHSEHYAVFVALRARTVRVQAMAETDGRRAPRDLSAAKWKAFFRAYAEDGTELLNEEMEKVEGAAADGDTGKFTLDVTFALADVGQARCEIALVDTSQSLAGTPSGKVEHELDLPWVAEIVAPPDRA